MDDTAVERETAALRDVSERRAVAPIVHGIARQRDGRAPADFENAFAFLTWTRAEGGIGDGDVSVHRRNVRDASEAREAKAVEARIAGQVEQRAARAGEHHEARLVGCDIDAVRNHDGVVEGGEAVVAGEKNDGVAVRREGGGPGERAERVVACTLGAVVASGADEQVPGTVTGTRRASAAARAGADAHVAGVGDACRSEHDAARATDRRAFAALAAGAQAAG